MPVSTLPDSRDIELPLLALLSDGKEHRWRDIVDKLADHFFVSDKGLNERYQESRQKRFYQRCGFAMQDLKKEGFVENPRRGYWKITSM